jgi:competence protein ComEA
MPRRPPPEPVSPRALARLRSPRTSYVPTTFLTTASDLVPESFEPSAAELRRAQRANAPRHGVLTDDMPSSRGVVPAPAVSAGQQTDRGWVPEEPAAVKRARARLSPQHDAEPPGRHSRVRLPTGWFRLPASVVGARWHPGRAAVLGVVVLALLAVAVFGLRVVWARTSSDGTVIAPGGGARAGPSGVSAGAVPVGVPTGRATTQPGGAATDSSPTPAPAAGGAGTAGATASAVVVVHVVGQVRRPGVRRLPVGSRVQDAVEAAGGPRPKADLARVNLARVLIDGEQVRVPAPGDPDPPLLGVGAGAPPGGSTAGGGASGTAPVSINTADLAGLDTLPGVGPVLAQRILDWRGEHGRFTSVDELGEVSGIGEKLLAQLRPLVTL